MQLSSDAVARNCLLYNYTGALADGAAAAAAAINRPRRTHGVNCRPSNQRTDFILSRHMSQLSADFLSLDED